MARRKRRKARPPESTPTPLPVVYLPRHPFQTDAQYAASRCWDEERAEIDAALLHLFRLAAADLGYVAACRRPACRRAHRCVGQMREGHPMAFLGRMVPACCNTAERFEAARARLRGMPAREPAPDDRPLSHEAGPPK